MDSLIYQHTLAAAVGHLADDPKALSHTHRWEDLRRQRLSPTLELAEEVAFRRARHLAAYVRDMVAPAVTTLNLDDQAAAAWWEDYWRILGPLVAAAAPLSAEEQRAGYTPEIKAAGRAARFVQRTRQDTTAATAAAEGAAAGAENVSPNGGGPTGEASPNAPAQQPAASGFTGAMPLAAVASPNGRGAHPPGVFPGLVGPMTGPNPAPAGAPAAVGGPFGIPGSPQGGYAPGLAPPGFGPAGFGPAGGVAGMPGGPGVATPGSVDPESPNAPRGQDGGASPNLPWAGAAMGPPPVLGLSAFASPTFGPPVGPVGR